MIIYTSWDNQREHSTFQIIDTKSSTAIATTLEFDSKVRGIITKEYLHKKYIYRTNIRK